MTETSESQQWSERFELPITLRILQRLEFPHKLGLCERLFSTKLALNRICWVDTAAGIPWKLDLRNATHRWIIYGKYEGAPFLDWARSFLPKNGIVVDSGANIGQMLLYLGQWVPRGKVIAIEPGKHQVDWLQACLRANPHLPVEVIQVGLGSTRGSAFLDLENPGAVDRHGSWNRVSASLGEPIEIVSLCQLLQERGIEKVDLWKLDVEGYEIPALEGAADWLADHRIRALYVELRGDNGRAIRDFLVPFGYECNLFSNSGRLHVPQQLPEDTNGLFLIRG